MTGLTPTSPGCGAEAVAGDLRMLLAAIPHAADPVILMSAGDASAAALIAPLQAAAVTIIPSSGMPAGMVIAVDAADFVSELAMSADFKASEATTIHEETDPAAIAIPGTPNVASAPLRSMYQTGCPVPAKLVCQLRCA